MAARLEGHRGESSVADICRKYQISESLYYVGGTSFWKLEVGPWHPGMRRSRVCCEGQDFPVGKDHWQASRSDRDFKKFRSKPDVVSLAIEVKNCGYPITAICSAFGWHRATFYRQLQAGQGSGSPALKFMGSRDPVGDVQLLASIKVIKQHHTFRATAGCGLG